MYMYKKFKQPKIQVTSIFKRDRDAIIKTFGLELGSAF